MTKNFKLSKIIPQLNEEVLAQNIFPYFYNNICGDLFLEKSNISQIVLENGEITKNIQSSSGGFSIRKVAADGMMYFLSSTDLSFEKILEYSEKLGVLSPKFPIETSFRSFELFSTEYFSSLVGEIYKVNYDTSILIMEIYTYIKKKGHVENLIISIACNANHREIFNEKTHVVEKFKVLWSLHINLVLKKDEKTENFYKGMSRQEGWDFLKNNWKNMANFVWESCYDLLHAIQVTAGIKTLVCAPGECGTMLHEAVGHALESDFLATNTSCFSGKQGLPIANTCVTVMDNGQMPYMRGTIEYDDEGTPAAANILIKDGIFVGELSNKFYSQKQNKNSSGNGRRENFACNVIPRMTNTFLMNGTSTLEEMILKISDGIFVKDIGGGQVDISTGSFVFEARLAYLIKDGKITTPIKGAMLMGNALEALFNITEVGNDFSLCNGSGNCGKNNQTVPVCVGCPSFTLENITVGGK